MSSEQSTLGKLLEGHAPRDAIHIAIVSVIAHERMFPGMPVGVNENLRASPEFTPHIGIIDPYLTEPVDPGDYCYLCLYPQSITALKHHWSHPVFDELERKLMEIADARDKSLEQAESEKWLDDFARRIGMEFTELVTSLDEYMEDGTEIKMGHDFSDMPGPCREEVPQMWRHYAIVRGLTPKARPSPFYTCC